MLLFISNSTFYVRIVVGDNQAGIFHPVYIWSWTFQILVEHSLHFNFNYLMLLDLIGGIS